MPRVVDLDGTLIRTDMLHESVLRVLRDSPGSALRIPFWLSRGKAALKERLAALVDIDPASLPYNADLLEWLKVQKAEGRKLILCAAHRGEMHDDPLIFAVKDRASQLAGLAFAAMLVLGAMGLSW